MNYKVLQQLTILEFQLLLASPEKAEEIQSKISQILESESPEDLDKKVFLNK